MRMRVKRKRKSTMTAEEFDRRFDEGEDITPYIDKSSTRRPGIENRRGDVDSGRGHPKYRSPVQAHRSDPKGPDQDLGKTRG